MIGASVWLRFAPDHPALPGHFPQHPIVPGVLLLDEALYAIEQCATEQALEPAGSHWFVASVKFHRVVRADESLRLQCLPQATGALRVEMHAAQALVVSATIERRRA
jgi:3-hydroxymyristoyl/3-hydroxydecanoyl-(acyl carrier protein) dehydratase